ncbi:MAG: fibronectin type III domain-containing protein, partial [Kiritimatiellaeota bacterium]|nr:fibronectin type III domain-containing protein [Kiritimatiellota bacterium]
MKRTLISFLLVLAATSGRGQISLGEALNCTGLTWTTDVYNPWVVWTYDTYDGLYTVSSGDKEDGSWIQATVTGPGTLSFWWRLQSMDKEVLWCEVDQNVVAGINGNYGWQLRVISIDAGTHTVRWRMWGDEYTYYFALSRGSLKDVRWIPTAPSIPPSTPTGVTASTTDPDKVQVSWSYAAGVDSYHVYRNTVDDAESAALLTLLSPLGGAATSYNDTYADPGVTYYYWVKAYNPSGDSSEFSVSAQGLRPVPPEIGQALNNTALTWIMSGAAPWFAQTAVTHDGVSALQSGAIVYYGSSYIETTVTGPGTLTFWWRVSSDRKNEYETSYESLRFYVDGNTSWDDPRFGTTSWAQKTVNIGAGTHTLKWSYSFEYSAYLIGESPGCGWLDQVTWTGVMPPAAPTGVTASTTYSSRVRVSWPATAGATSYKVYRNTTDDSGGATQIGTVTASPYNDTTAVAGTTYYYWVKASSSAGDSGFSASAQGSLRADGQQDSYLSDPADGAEGGPAQTTAYDGFLYDTNKTVRGTVTLKATAKVKADKKMGIVTTNWTVSAKAVVQ